MGFASTSTEYSTLREMLPFLSPLVLPRRIHVGLKPEASEPLAGRHVEKEMSLRKGILKIRCSAAGMTGRHALMMPRLISSPDHRASSTTVMVKFNFASGVEKWTTLYVRHAVAKQTLRNSLVS